ncbi:MAG: HD domain-containing protein [Desulfuromonadales bacterium]|nr:HD domain-containing protein [Desulfuromonadales bacterium]
MINSLKIKIIGLVAFIVIVTIGISSWINFSDQKTMQEEMVRQSSVVLVESILTSIRTSMKLGHATEINNILTSIKSPEHIKSLRIISTDGKILHSSDNNRIGQYIPREEHNSLLAHANKVSFFISNKNDHFDSYSRISNSSECHGCHPDSQATIAFLETDLSLSKHVQYIKRMQQNAIFSAVLIITLIIGTVSTFLILYVDRPVRQLIQSMHRVEAGDFSVMANISSSNELTLLSRHFNLMTIKLKVLMSTAVTHERELTRAEDKLAHLRKTQQLNLKLDEHFKEIENLNVSLEERIEEIEQANYTITDLASELEHKNLHLGRAVERLSTIYKIGLAINSTMDIDRLINLIVRTTTTTLKATIGYIILYDAKNGCMNVTNLIESGKLLAPKTSIPLKDSGVSTWVIKNRQSILIADINDMPQFDRFSALGYERRSLICAPLMVKDEIIGTISVVNKIDESRFDAEELEMLNTIAAQAAISIKNATLYDEQQQTYLNTIQALVSAIEASDSYTRGHSERVTRYSLEIGRRLNLPADRMQILERAAILHDIGKIGIDQSLLHKEGKLTPHDIMDLQLHPSIGVHILEPIEFLHDVRVCIGQHHERFDGMGYPNRIKKDELSIEARILAIADAFDAMTSDRPYRKALSFEIAIAELRDNAGTQFDPELVKVFLQVIDEGDFSQFRFNAIQPQPYMVDAVGNA